MSRVLPWIAALLAALLVRAGPLDLPYWWDEGDVYVPGARWVAAHGLDVTPGVFPDDWSRGHPPLWFLMLGTVFWLFGSDPIVGHLALLPLTVVSLAGTVLMTQERFDVPTGWLAGALLATTPLFMSISAQALPEVPLITCTVLAFWAISRGRLWPAVAAGVCAVWIKETGIFTAGAVSVVIAWDALRRRDRTGARRLLISTVPIAALGLFFLWQRATAGYFVFPHHQNLFWDRPWGLANGLTIVPSTLLWHGRWVVLLSAAMVALAARLIRPSDRGAPAPGPWQPATESWAMGWLSLWVVNALFFAKMFWLERYVLPVHPGICIGCAAGTVYAARRLDARTVFAWLPGLATVGLQALGLFSDPGADQEELTFAYADVIATHQQAYVALEELALDDPLVLTTWPMTTELREPSLGFVDAPVRSLHPDHLGDHPDAVVDVVLISDGTPHRDRLTAKARALGLQRHARFDAGAGPSLTLWTR